MSTTIARRTGSIAWGALGVCCVAFGVFEAAKHGGLTWYLFFAGALLPALPLPEAGRSIRKWVLLFPAAPLAVLVYFSVFPSTTDLAAPGFTLGLMWLAHLAVSRALGRGRSAAHRPDRTVGG
jgi:hypothetical protein